MVHEIRAEHLTGDDYLTDVSNRIHRHAFSVQDKSDNQRVLLEIREMFNESGVWEVRSDYGDIPMKLAPGSKLETGISPIVDSTRANITLAMAFAVPFVHVRKEQSSMGGFLKSWASRYQSVWNNKPYIYLLVVAFLSLSGDLIAAVATTWTLTTKTENPAFFITASIFVTQAAFVVASPIMGNVIDRLGTLRSLIGATVVRAVIIALLAYFVAGIEEGVSPWILIALLGFDYAISPISRTGEFVLIQTLVAEEDMMAANALQGIQYDLGFIVDPILGDSSRRLEWLSGCW